MSGGRSLREATTLRVGGVPRLWESVSTQKQLEEVVRQSNADGALLRVLGGGSNVLARDGMLDCVVLEVRNTHIQSTEDGDVVMVTAGAGVSWDQLVVYTVERGWWGLENLSAIPGTVGAAPVQNIGAYGTELSMVCTSVTGFDRDLERFRTLAHHEMQFGYRDSVFKREPHRYVIWEVVFRLSKKPLWQLSYKDLETYFGAEKQPALIEVRAAVALIRAKKFPNLTQVGTAGSFFKNPVLTMEQYREVEKQVSDLPQFPTGVPGFVKISAAYVLDQMEYKGQRSGSVGMHDQHALVLVAYSGATAHEVDVFAQSIEKNIEEKIGVRLEREVQFFP